MTQLYSEPRSASNWLNNARENSRETSNQKRYSSLCSITSSVLNSSGEILHYSGAEKVLIGENFFSEALGFIFILHDQSSGSSGFLPVMITWDDHVSYMVVCGTCTGEQKSRVLFKHNTLLANSSILYRGWAFSVFGFGWSCELLETTSQGMQWKTIWGWTRWRSLTKFERKNRPFLFLFQNKFWCRTYCESEFDLVDRLLAFCLSKTHFIWKASHYGLFRHLECGFNEEKKTLPFLKPNLLSAPSFPR